MGESREEYFKPLGGEDQEITEIESLCMTCQANGMTKLLLTKIPFYKEVIISSFSCPHCFSTNNEIQSAGELQLQGVKYNLEVKELEDLNRQVVKSDYTSVTIPQLDLEIPSKSQKGEITTVEGIIVRIIAGLEQEQPIRKISHPEDFSKIEEFLRKVRDCQQAKTPFSLKLRDISGNSFVSSRPSALPGHKDDCLHMMRFSRTREEDNEIGYYPQIPTINDEEESDSEELDIHAEVLALPTNCPDCLVPCITNVKLTKIPHFKEVVIMATNCDNCGSRSNEVKSGAGIEPNGVRHILEITNVDDLSRDVLKSDTCSIEIPELELEVGSGLLGGKFTTVEGLLGNIKEQISQENPLFCGDSVDPKMKEKMTVFWENFEKLMSCESKFTIILDDPAGNSYLQNVYAPDDDPHMKVEKYERTFEQNDDLGLNDMNVGEPEIGNQEC